MPNLIWEEVVAQLVLIKTEMQKCDINNLWDYHLPNVKKNEIDILYFEDEKK